MRCTLKISGHPFSLLVQLLRSYAPFTTYSFYIVQFWDWSISYRKNSKIWDTSNSCHNCPKNRKVWCNIALMHPKDADGMANSVDPDQTASSEAVWFWSALFAETYLSQYIEFVGYIKMSMTWLTFELISIYISFCWGLHIFRLN